MTNSKLAIITVIFENYTVLGDFFESLRIQTNKNFHLYIIDVSIHRNKIPLNNLPSTVIFSENKGYAHGINVGLKKSMKDGNNFFCIINNDVYFKENFIKNSLKSILDHPSSIIGGKIYYAPGFEYHKNRYKKSDLGKVLWYAGGKIDWDHGLTPHGGVDTIDKGQYGKLKEVEFVNGALMLFDRQVIERVGFWDEAYFLYFEDADFCVRAKRKSIKLYYDPQIIIWHKNAQSTGGSGSRLHQKYQKINRLRFGLKYAPFKTKLHLLKNYVASIVISKERSD